MDYMKAVNAMSTTTEDRIKSIEKQRDLMIKQREEWTNKFISDNLKFYPDANKDVLEFIANFLYHGVPEVPLEISAETIRSTFRAGYCYHFACMLKQMFGRGCVCWTAPFSHMVWMDIDGTPYDIEGIHSGENEYYIPEDYLKYSIWSFQHVPGVTGTVRDADKIIKEYKDDLFSGNLAKNGLLYTATSK